MRAKQKKEEEMKNLYFSFVFFGIGVLGTVVVMLGLMEVISVSPVWVAIYLYGYAMGGACLLCHIMDHRRSEVSHG